jgi:L-cysteine S-thiosulfotransferase
MIRAIRSLVLLIGVFSSSAIADSRQSAYELLSPANQAMQNDMSLNPALFAVLDGEVLWNEKSSVNGKSCSSCHGDVKKSMRGVSAQYPKVFKKQLINLEARINICRTTRQGLSSFNYESKPLLDLSTLIAFQSRGLPIQASVNRDTENDLREGKQLYFQRIGQLNLSCAQCHDERAGLKLAGSTIPQGHPTAYPIYRLEWQGMGSLQRRLRNCMSGVRAEQYPYGSKELTQIELFLMQRASGMTIESPGIRP